MVVQDSQCHKHTATCAKNSRAGNDADCRMGFPRPLNPTTAALESGCVLLRRDYMRIVPYLPALMLALPMMALPMNMAIYLFADTSRHSRDLALYNQAIASGVDPAVLGDPPTLNDVGLQVAEAAEYALKYAGKPEGGKVLYVIAKAIQRLASNTARYADKDAQARAQANITRMVNPSNGALQVSSSQAAFYMLNNKDSITSHTVHLLPSYADSPTAEAAKVEIAAERATVVTTYTDYEQCPPELQHLPPIAYLTLFRKERLRNAASEPDGDDSDSEIAHSSSGSTERYFLRGGRGAHPHANTHVLVRRKIAAVPQFCAEPPLRRADTADDVENEKYAAFALGMFATRAQLAGKQPDETLWALFNRTAFEPIFAAILDNLHEHADARSKHTLFRAEQRSAGRSCFEQGGGGWGAAGTG